MPLTPPDWKRLRKIVVVFFKEKFYIYLYVKVTWQARLNFCKERGEKEDVEMEEQIQKTNKYE